MRTNEADADTMLLNIVHATIVVQPRQVVIGNGGVQLHSLGCGLHVVKARYWAMAIVLNHASPPAWAQLCGTLQEASASVSRILEHRQSD